MSVQRLRTLTLFVGPADKALVLPQHWVDVVGDITDSRESYSNPCGRCDQTWEQHAWLVYNSDPGNPLECSNRVRTITRPS